MPRNQRFTAAPGKVYVSSGEGEEVAFGAWVPRVYSWVTNPDQRRTGVVTAVDYQGRVYTVTYVERATDLTGEELAYAAYVEEMDRRRRREPSGG
jgi:hypothetical protein